MGPNTLSPARRTAAALAVLATVSGLGLASASAAAAAPSATGCSDPYAAVRAEVGMRTLCSSAVSAPAARSSVAAETEATPPGTAVVGDEFLQSGETLAYTPGQEETDNYVISPNGQYFTFQQDDGNLVQYGNGTAIFNTGTFTSPGARTVMQDDGNLVVYSSANVALFNTRTNGNPGAYAELQDDGNFVVYSADGTRALFATFAPADRLVDDSDGPAGPGILFSSEDQAAAGSYQYLTSRSYGQIALLGGNQLFVGGTTTGATFASPASSTTGDLYTLEMQPDGNLVVYAYTLTTDGTDFTSTPVWSTRTDGNAGASATMQNDGNLVVYSASGRALWSSKFGRTY